MLQSSLENSTTQVSSEISDIAMKYFIRFENADVRAGTGGCAVPRNLRWVSEIVG